MEGLSQERRPESSEEDKASVGRDASPGAQALTHTGIYSTIEAYMKN